MYLLGNNVVSFINLLFIIYLATLDFEKNQLCQLSLVAELIMFVF